MKKAVKILIAIIACLIVVGAGSLMFLFHNQYAAAQSVEQVGNKMYTMTYEGDYELIRTMSWSLSVVWLPRK